MPTAFFLPELGFDRWSVSPADRSAVKPLVSETEKRGSNNRFKGRLPLRGRRP
jgi:hypothetical protein